MQEIIKQFYEQFYNLKDISKEIGKSETYIKKVIKESYTPEEIRQIKAKKSLYLSEKCRIKRIYLYHNDREYRNKKINYAKNYYKKKYGKR